MIFATKISQIEKGCGCCFPNGKRGWGYECGHELDGLCKSCQATLNTTIELSKQVEDVLDFIDNFPIWLKIKDKETGKSEEVPEWMFPIIESFWNSQKELIKQKLSSIGSDKSEVSK